MRKLTLDLDELVVESFETGRDGASARGTVRAQAATPNGECIPTPLENYTEDDGTCLRTVFTYCRDLTCQCLSPQGTCDTP